MKKIIINFLFCTTSILGFTQFPSTLTIQPDALTGKDALLWSIMSTTTTHGDPSVKNFGSKDDFQAGEWTWEGSPGTQKAVLGFDLSDLPKDATITSATLSLYHSSGSFWDPLTFGYEPNEVLIQRTTSSWDEGTVTWVNQPSVTVENQVIIPSSTSSNQSFPSIDITKLVEDVLADNNKNLEMMLSSKLKTHYRMKSFATSNHVNSQLHPKLVIEYTTPCTTYRPGPTTGKGALLWSVMSTTTAHGDPSVKNFGVRMIFKLGSGLGKEAREYKKLC